MCLGLLKPRTAYLGNFQKLKEHPNKDGLNSLLPVITNYEF
jgi:hypothetical protein